MADVVFSTEELADMHLVYGLAQGNGRAAHRLYTERFPMRRAPHHTLFARLHQNLRERGSFMVSFRSAYQFNFVC